MFRGLFTLIIQVYLSLIRPGFFYYLKLGGGGGGADSDLGHGAMKNSEIWHIHRVSQYKLAEEISILKSIFFYYANIYVNQFYAYFPKL